MVPDLVPLQQPNKALQRDLGGSNDQDVQSLLVNSNGEGYDPYSLSWRYLGAYIDCDPQDMQQGEGSHDRKLSGSGDGDNCDRKVLWAAYWDRGYRGKQIGEYQFYDWVNQEWDSSTCETHRCARMDCHETGSHYKLIGVYKEDGLYDFHEQLFKHAGICLWGEGGHNDNEDNDLYESMTNHMEKWPNECTQLYLSDNNGSTVYLHTQPLPEGKLTYGLYSDENCSQLSDFTFSDYLVKYYSTYYGSESKGWEEAASWQQIFDTWNTGMEAFKVCHPCRAFSMTKNYDEDNSQSGDRFLDYVEQNDGDGQEEMWGYNCFDDAGYTNCNQCYKFETQTDMEVASAFDLARASAQGTIMAIKVDGIWYGEGKFSKTISRSSVVAYSVGGASLVIMLTFLFQKQIRGAWKTLRAQRRNMKFPKGLRRVIAPSPSDDSYVRAKEVSCEQAIRLDTMQKELDKERAMRYLEQNRSSRYIRMLEKQITSGGLKPSPSFEQEYGMFQNPSQTEPDEMKASDDEQIDILAIASMPSIASRSASIHGGPKEASKCPKTDD